MKNTEPLSPEKPLVSDRTFNALRALVELILPALGVFYFALAELWNLDYGLQVVGTITAIATLGGVILRALRSKYDNSDAKYDGEMVVNLQDPMKDTFRLEVGDPVETIPNSDELRLRVRHEK